MNIKKEIQRVIAVQAASLVDLNKRINGAFGDAVKMIYRCKGKIIVTGVGKSGLIAQKIASTLSSTGTPAIFLHPTEAMHGSLGIVLKTDIVLAIGKSGESEELLTLIPSFHRIGAKVIALTSNRQSSLARQASVVIHVPVKREVCPLNLAPTTSTTLTLVVGDAIAIALMKMRGFGADAFALYHPGGLLGKKLLLRAEDVMRAGRNNPVVRIDDPLNKLLSEITEKTTGAASVVDKKGRLIGLITDYDLRSLLAHPQRLAQASIRDIMNTRPTFVYFDDMAVKTLDVMENRKKPFSVLPVIDRKKRCVGMIHIHDLITRGLVQAKGNG